MLPTTSASLMPPLRRVARYRRVSTDDQAEWGTSLQDQDQQTRAAIAAHRGWVDDGGDYTDDGVSGTLRHRPAMDRILERCRRGEVDVMLCTKLDRFARKLKTMLYLWDAIEATGASIVIIEESIDTSTPIGRFLRNVLGAIAEFEVETFRARTMAGRRLKASRGHVWRRYSPMGLKAVKGDREAGVAPHLEIDGAVFPLIVQELVQRIGSGEISATKLAEEFNARGVPTQRGGRWHHRTITAIIHNPAIHGAPAYGRYSYESYESEDGRRRRRVRKGTDPITASGPALVTKEEVEAAQAALVRNQQFATRNAKRLFLLNGGLIVCAECGEPHHWTGSVTGCSARYRCRQDGHHSVVASVIEDAVWDALLDLLRDPRRVFTAMRRRQTRTRIKRGDAATETTALERAVGEVDRQRGELLDLRLAHVVDDTVYRSKDTALAASRATLAARLDALTPAPPASGTGRASLDDGTVARISALWAAVAARLGDAEPADKAHVMRRVVRRVVARREQVTIEGALPASVEVDGSALQDGGRIAGLASPNQPDRFHTPTA